MKLRKRLLVAVLAVPLLLSACNAAGSDEKAEKTSNLSFAV